MTLTFDRPGQLERPASDWTREDTGRPLVKPDPAWSPEQLQAWLARGQVKDGMRPYTRVTTFGEALLDGTMLSRWKMRRVALGMGRRPDYVVAAAALTAEDRDRDALNDLAEKALEAAGPNAADIGTALHGFSERIDRGEPLGVVPPEYRDGLERYREVVQQHLTWRHREERMVCDVLETAGTPDGIARCDQPDPDGVVDLWRIVDLKTGNVERTAGKFSCQLGIYANSALYDAATGERTWLADLDTRWGLVLHMPAGAGTAELRWLNLEHGWLGAQIAGPVRKWRTVNHADLMRPLIPVERVVAPDMCRGVKRDGEACTFKAKTDGMCTRHQGQDPEAVRPARVQEVAGVLSQAISDVPEPLRVAPLEQPATVSTAVEEPVDDPITWCDCRADEQCPPGQLCRRRSHLPDPRQPVPEPRPELNGNPRPHTSMPDPDAAQDAAVAAELSLMDQVRACRSTGELDILWQTTGQAWTDAVKKYAKRHRDLMPQLAQEERTGAALHAAIVHAENLTELRRLFEDPRNVPLITQAHKDAARDRAAQLPPF